MTHTKPNIDICAELLQRILERQIFTQLSAVYNDDELQKLSIVHCQLSIVRRHGDGMNRSAYCGNDPVNFVDPSGNYRHWIQSEFAAGTRGWTAAQRQLFDYLYDRITIEMQHGMSLRKEDENLINFINGKYKSELLNAWSIAYGVSIIPNDVYAAMVQTPTNEKQAAKQASAVEKALDIVADAVGAVGSLFGAGATTVIQENVELEHLHFLVSGISPLLIQSGTRTSKLLDTYGDSSKPISVYATGRADNKILSSAGLKINISNFTLTYSLGVDNFGVSGSIKNGNQSTSFGIKADLSSLKVGFEGAKSTTTNNVTTTNYTNVSINGWVIAAGYLYYKTGQLELSSVPERVPVRGW